MFEFNDTQKLIYKLLEDGEEKKATEMIAEIKKSTGRNLTRNGLRQLIDRMNSSEFFHENWKRIKVEAMRGRGNVAKYQLID